MGIKKNERKNRQNQMQETTVHSTPVVLRFDSDKEALSYMSLIRERGRQIIRMHSAAI